MTDEKLYQLCKQYGRKSLHWRRRFIGLLPEVNKRGLHEKKGFRSIFEFVAKLASLSQDQVRLTLNLERRLEELPALKGLLVEGKASLNKLTRIVSIATVNNEKELAWKVEQLSQAALETLARDERVFQKQNGLSKPLFEVKSLRAQTRLHEVQSSKSRPLRDSLNFELSAEVLEELNTLHTQGQDMNQLLLKLLKERKEKIKEKKEKLSKEAERTDSRYIPVLTQELLEEEYGKKCCIKRCLRPTREIHHSQRFSLAHTHDPKYLAPLCHEHHSIAHALDRKAAVYRTSGRASGRALDKTSG